jgi:hypothetical protein
MRSDVLWNLRIGGTVANKRGWQKNYVQDRQPNGKEASEHQTKIDLRGFSPPPSSD